MSGDYLAPPRARYVNPEHIVPISPPSRPPFSQYHSSSTLPPTPQTPYPQPPPPSNHPPGPSSRSRLKPYLELPSRILLTTLSPCLLPFILTIAHLIYNRSSTESLANSLRASLLSACAGIATGAATLQTLPRYLAMQTNDQAVRATQASILAMGSALGDCVTIIEAVVTFMVDTYRSMLLCTIELAVRGALEVLIGAVKTISDGITNSLNSIRSGIQSDIDGANRIIQEAVSRVNSVVGFMNINISVPQFSVPSLTGLQDVQIPTGFEDSLIKLNDTLPTLAALKDKMNALISIPFEKLKAEINETRLEMAASFNSSILPVPSLNQLSANKANAFQDDLCGDLDTSLIDDTAKALRKLSNISIGLMFLLLFLLWATLIVWEWRRWRVMKETVEAVEDEWRREGTQDAWRVVAIVEHPVIEKYGTGLLHRATQNPRTRTNIRWFMSYISHPTCLALFFIAFIGFLSIQFQLLALNAIKNHARANANATVAASTNSLTSKLNAMALQQSQEYASEYNTAIGLYQQRIDDELFGKWMNTTAIQLNSTLEEFYDEVQNALNVTFGGTILFNPINTFMYCILGSKVDNLQKGLTWISQHAKITLPTLPPDILLLSGDSMKEMVAPISAAAVGSSSSGDDEGIVGSLIEHFEKALEVERNFYAIMLGIWLFFILVGIMVVLWHSGGKDKYDEVMARRRIARGDMDGEDIGKSKFWPWEKEDHPIYDQHAEKERQFRGTSPSPTKAYPVPRIVETRASTFSGGDGDGGPVRPFVGRNGTFGSTLSSLAAPGQAFLRLASRSRYESDSPVAHDDHQQNRQFTSEKYINLDDPDERGSTTGAADGTGTGTSAQFWVNKWYRAVDTAKGLFPTRGQKHGAALARNGSTRTLGSFGTSQVNTPTRAQYDNWGQAQQVTSGSGSNLPTGGWDMINPQEHGRSLDQSQIHRRTSSSDRYRASKGIYPRPISRAPTLPEGTAVPQMREINPTGQSHNLHPTIDPFDDNDDDYSDSEVLAPVAKGDKHDSIDYLEPKTRDYGYEEELLSPAMSASTSTSSLNSYYHVNSVHVGSADRVKVKTGTAALAEIFKNMDQDKNAAARERSNGSGTQANPFATPFDEYRSNRI